MTDRFAKIVRVLTALGLGATLLLLVGCATSDPTPSGSGASKAPEAQPSKEVASTGPMTIKVLEPVAGAEVPAGTLKITVETTGLKFVMPSNTLVPGEGHVHFTLDDRPVQMSTEPSAQFDDVAAGPHTLKAELVQNDTNPFDPPVEEVIEFTAK